MGLDAKSEWDKEASPRVLLHIRVTVGRTMRWTLTFQQKKELSVLLPQSNNKRLKNSENVYLHLNAAPSVHVRRHQVTLHAYTQFTRVTHGEESSLNRWLHLMPIMMQRTGVVTAILKGETESEVCAEPEVEGSLIAVPGDLGTVCFSPTECSYNNLDSRIPPLTA